VEHEKLEERGGGMRTAPFCCVVFVCAKKETLESRGSCCDFNQFTFSIKEG
jgi:hypothetical protein